MEIDPPRLLVASCEVLALKGLYDSKKGICSESHNSLKGGKVAYISLSIVTALVKKKATMLFVTTSYEDQYKSGQQTLITMNLIGCPMCSNVSDSRKSYNV